MDSGWLDSVDLEEYLQAEMFVRDEPPADLTWVRPFQDIRVIEETAYRWYTLVYNEGGLTPRPLGSSELPDNAPEWLEWLGSSDDLGSELHPHPYTTRTGWIPPESWPLLEKFENGPPTELLMEDTWVVWGLEMGIAPGTPFLVCTPPPKWQAGDYYSNEGDWEFDSYVIAATPRTTAQATRSWERYFNRLRAARDKILKRLIHNREAAARDSRNMTITVDYWNDRVSMSLRSTRYALNLARGEGKTHHAALLEILATCRVRYPRLDSGAVVRLALNLAVPVTLDRYERVVFNVSPV